MKTLKITILILLSTTCLFAQTILEQYFKGDKEKMMVEAEKLIATPDPMFSQPLKVSNLANNKLLFKKETIKENKFKVRDGKNIFTYHIPANSDKTIILIHGVKNNASEYLNSAYLLSKKTNSEVFAIDLRGHGKSEGDKGDVDYINQYADDIEDIISQISNKKVYIAGHSMGGGIAIRLAKTTKNNNIKAFILFAPLLGHNTPTIRTNNSSDNPEIESAMKLNIAKIIGLKMLNELGIQEKNSLPVLFFNNSDSTSVTKYTYRANMSMAPEDYLEGLTSINNPFLVVIGDKDEAFDSSKMKAIIEKQKNGDIKIFSNISHKDIKENSEVFDYIKNWLIGIK